MIDKLVNGYNSLKENAVNILGNGIEGLNDELEFLDDAIVASKIRFLQKICKNIDNELCFEDGEKKEFLITKKQEFMNEIAILASNSIKNIDFCLYIIDEKMNFKKCLNALKCYEDGDKKEAKRLFDEYFSETKYIIEHFLISEVYGTLLFESGDYYNAALFIRKAVEKRPEEINLHIMLRDIYTHLGEEILLNSENEIINILKG